MNDKPNKASLLTISTEQSGQRIDNFLLTRLKGVPKSHVYRLLRSGQVRVNSGRKKPHYRLQAGDKVRMPPVRTSQRPAASIPDALKNNLQNAILFENAHLLVIDKPAGLPVHSGSGYQYGVIDVLRQARPQQQLELVHRLDRETSGCLLLAKSRQALQRCHAAFRDEHANAVGKHYLTLVMGNWPGIDTVDIGIEKVTRSGERMMQSSEQGASAISHFECQQHLQTTHNGEPLQASLMRVRIETGRTHQIRVHARYKNHPIACDSKYGDKHFNSLMKQAGLNRLFLHASKLELDLNELGAIAVASPLPQELQHCIDTLQ